MNGPTLSTLANRPSDNTAAGAYRMVFPAQALAPVLWPFLLTRSAAIIIGLLATRFWLPSAPISQDWWNTLGGFDGLWYLKIARDGYFFDPTRQSSIAFAPLFPMLMRGIGALLGSTDHAYVAAGLLISNICLIVALFFVRALTDELLGDAAARRVVWYVLICPGTIFLSVVYPMSLMLAIGSGAIWFARRQRWEMASAIGMLAPLARPDGVLLALPLLLEAIGSRRFDRRSNWILMIPAMSALWLAGQWVAFGTPIAFIQAQKMWEPSPFITVLHSSRAALILCTAAFFVLLTVLSCVRLPASHSLYATLFLAVMLWAGRLWSLPRFVVILFPCFMTLAWLGARWKWLHIFYVVSATLLAALFTIRFSLGLWVA
jgi:hypothetical protein